MAPLNVPSREDIWNELRGSTYRNGGVNNNSLFDMYEYITGNTSGYSRSFFDGHGRPEVSVVGVSNITDSSADVELSLDFTSGEPTNYDVEYDTDSAFGSYDTEFGGQQSSTGNVVVTIINLQADTTYYVRGAVYNLWNDNAPNDPNDYVRSGQTSFTTDTAQLDSPNNLSGEVANTDNFDMSWDSTNGTEADDYDLEYRKYNSGNPWRSDGGGWISTTNWGTTNSSRSGVYDSGVSDLTGNDWEVRIRAVDSSGGKPASNWTQTTVLGQTPN